MTDPWYEQELRSNPLRQYQTTIRIYTNPHIPWRSPINPELKIRPDLKWISEGARAKINDWLMDRFGWEETVIMQGANAPGGAAIYCHPRVEQTIRDRLRSEGLA